MSRKHVCRRSGDRQKMEYRDPPWVLTRAQETVADKRLYGVVAETSEDRVQDVFGKSHLLNSHDLVVFSTHFSFWATFGLGDKLFRNAANLVFEVIARASGDSFSRKDVQEYLLPLVIEALCKFEGSVSASECTITMHQLYHVVYDIEHYGPPRMQWMFLFERMNKFLKGLIRNVAKPISSIIKNYNMSETSISVVIKSLNSTARYHMF